MHQSALACPRCRQWLYVGQAQHTTMWGCGHCGGVWLDNHTAQRVVQTVCQASLQLAQSAAQSARAKVELTVNHLPCPVCHAPMRSERVQQAWLDIDRCDQHGTWYDKGELEKVARTAHVQASDWRSAPAPAQHNPYAQQQGYPQQGYAQPGYAQQGGYDDDDGWDNTEIAAEVAVEGSFILLDIVLAMMD